MSENLNTDWDCLKKEKLLETPVFDIVKKKKVCPRNNISGNFFKIECPNDWVNVVALTENKEIVMIKQFRHGSEKLELEIPGGLIDEGETPIQAGIRELEEETGYIGENARLLGHVCPNPALQGNKCFSILVENAKKKKDTAFDEGEDIESVLTPVEDLKKMVKSGEITHSLVVNAIFYFDIEMGNKA